MCVIAGLGLSVGTIAIDKAFDYELVPEWISGGPDAALEILGTVAASMVSLAALVLTITMVVVQLAMGQFSPRIVQRILQDKPSQLAIGVFVGTFAHAMLTLREVQTDGGGTVPGLAVLVAFILVVVSIMVLVWYVNHIGRKLRVSALIELVGTDTRNLLDTLYPDAGAPRRFERPTICAPHSGVVTRVDYRALVRIAEEADCTLNLLPALGEFVPAGAALFEVEGARERLDSKAALDCVDSGLERTLDQDLAYGLRMLVDIAERSLAESPFLDPTTAVQAIDRLHDCLRQMAPRPFPDGRHRDDHGVERLITRVMTWDDYVHLAFDEIRLAGAGSPQIERRMRAALEDLLTIAPPDRKGSLQKQLDLLDSGSQDAMDHTIDRQRASRADTRGLG
ncbi:hypothetical protein GCM10011487_26040 [Steroidobacter agaridevorans]|uniref:DUF2254 domain-containing protein n=2 Tax=Steroidobacter agaridevorans TaxID=2695856 RepID=A0A829YB55_9GAMM|nr:hypothetical protein GCM10011487_26040 [Steroidobacter agaridevorans]GFE87658.1 hypothetical protein GCM10011488_26120 [Steroidobacter agaridevorans]